MENLIKYWLHKSLVGTIIKFKYNITKITICIVMSAPVTNSTLGYFKDNNTILIRTKSNKKYFNILPEVNKYKIYSTTFTKKIFILFNISMLDLYS